MKLFACEDGTLINPENVTDCRQGMSEGHHTVRFNFIGGTTREILFCNKDHADKEVIAFMRFCAD